MVRFAAPEIIVGHVGPVAGNRIVDKNLLAVLVGFAGVTLCIGIECHRVCDGEGKRAVVLCLRAYRRQNVVVDVVEFGLAVDLISIVFIHDCPAGCSGERVFSSPLE